ncbi:MAG TPA: hypothetical protein VFX97_16940 [Pyrinomonadaceae bacterium]|nr:hypothetical protein [Pyrinomonadaceae bacterium]
MKYKFVSSGQNVDDALVVSQTLRGQSLKPPGPSNILGERNSAGDLYTRWTRRSRIAGGLRPSTDVPLAEEKEEFLVEWYSGSTLKRSMNVSTGMAMAAVLEGNGASKFAGIDGNSAAVSGSAQALNVVSLQTITQAGNFIEATLESTLADSTIIFGLIPTTRDWRASSATPDYRVELSSAGAGDLLELYGGTTLLHSEDASAYAATGVRIRLILSGSEVRFVKDWTPGAPALAVSPIAPTYPLRLFARVSVGSVGTSNFRNAMMTTDPTPGTIYSAAQQTLDFGSTQSAIKVRIYSRSAVVGLGDYTEKTI